MGWENFFDDIFSGSSGGGEGGGGGSFAQYGLSEIASQVPYIGQYLGFYLGGHEDLSELTNFPSGGDNVDADTAGSDHPYRKEFGIDEGTNQKLLRNPNLLAENSVPKMTVEAWMTAPTTPSGTGQEIVLVNQL